MAIATRPLTYDDLVDFPDDGRRYEILSGGLLVSPAPVPEHQELLIRLASLFFAFVRRHDLGKVYTAPLNIRLSNHDVVQPDLLFIAREREEIITATSIDGVPDLVVEILSPGTRGIDGGRKATLYAAAGVREYWLVDPRARSITIATPTNGRFEPVARVDGIARSTILPGFESEMAPLFAGLG
jgi:Uma2 family endonuclease